MISVEKALKFVHSQKVILKSGLSISTRNGLGYVLSDDLIAPISLPNFRQSSMDGYGLSDTKSLTYKVVGEIKAGDYYKKKINKGEAIRIFTGAHVPDSVKSVIIQEKVIFKNNTIKLKELPKLYSNIRDKGDQIKKGEIALKKGFLLNEARLGLISSLGIKKIKVYEKPKVSILITGNELISIDNGKKIVQKAISHLRILKISEDFTYVELNPITGRKHQLRKQLYNIGNPIVGDDKYFINRRADKIKIKNKNLMLHAYKIKFMINNIKYNFKAEYDLNFENFLKTNF